MPKFVSDEEVNKFSKNLVVVERPEFIRTEKDVQEVLSKHELSYVACVLQFQFFDDGLIEYYKKYSEKYPLPSLKEADIFEVCYVNDSLAWKKHESEPKSLALRQITAPSLIRPQNNYTFPYYGRETIEDKILGIFNTTLIVDIGLHVNWKKEYPKITIATLNSSRLTDQILATAEKISNIETASYQN